MNSAPRTLPDDPLSLKKIILERESDITARDQTIQHQQRRIDALEEFIRLQKQRQFGARSEKASEQRELFDEAEELVETAEQDAQNDVEAESAQAPKTKTRKPGRKPLPKELPRTRIEHDLPASEQVCACGCGLTLIGEETSEQLDIIPAQVRVLVHVRKKYACKACEEGVTLAPLPAQPIPKSMASPGLLAHIATAKYQDGLPLHRQEGQFKRIGVDLSRTTLARWMIQGAEVLQPLYNLMQDRLLSSPYLHGDETPVVVVK